MTAITHPQVEVRMRCIEAACRLFADSASVTSRKANVLDAADDFEKAVYAGLNAPEPAPLSHWAQKSSGSEG